MKACVLLAVVAAMMAGCVDVKVGGDAPAIRTTGLLRHVVLVRFKEGTSSRDIRNVERSFRELPKKIDEIRDFEWGTDVSVEELAKGYTHCFFVTFKNAADRDAYLPHPAHKAFVDVLKPHLEEVLVIDYVAGR